LVLDLDPMAARAIGELSATAAVEPHVSRAALHGGRRLDAEAARADVPLRGRGASDRRGRPGQL